MNAVLSGVMANVPLPIYNVTVDTVRCLVDWHGHVTPDMKRIQFRIHAHDVCVLEDGERYEAHVMRMSPFKDASRFNLSFADMITFLVSEIDL